MRTMSVGLAAAVAIACGGGGGSVDGTPAGSPSTAAAPAGPATVLEGLSVGDRVQGQIEIRPGDQCVVIRLRK